MALKKHDKFHLDAIKEIADELGLDKRVVDLIATHPFLFKTRVMRNPNDDRPIRDRYLGIFAIIHGRKKK